MMIDGIPTGRSETSWAVMLISMMLLYGLSVLPVMGEIPLVAGYLEGEVTWKHGSQPVEFGTVFTPEDTIHLGDDGYLEITTGERTVRLVGPGEYRLGEVTSDGGVRPGLTAALGLRVQRALRDERRGDLAAAGVRGDFGEVETWDAPTIAQEVRTAAIQTLRAGRIEEAEILFEEALLYATDREEPALRIDLAELLLGEGRFGDAVTTTDDLPASARDARYYRARVTALHAVAMFESTLELVRESRDHQLPLEVQVHLEGLAADAALALGDDAAATEALRRITELDPESTWATAARRMLNELE